MTAEETLTAAPNSARKIIVAIDGPAGAGKSTIARHLARHFGLLNLETGAMYRAFALKALRSAVALDDAKALEELTHETEIRLDPGEEENLVLLDGEDVTGQIRNPTVTEAASRVSVFPAVRAWLVRLQQQIGARGGVVMKAATSAPSSFLTPTSKYFWTLRRKSAASAATSRSAKKASRPRHRMRPRPPATSLRRREEKKFCATSAPAMSATAIAKTLRSRPRPTPSFLTPQT